MEDPAFARCFDAHYGAVVAYARRRGAPADEAHDVAAEVFAIAWRRRDAIPIGAERPWLLGVARRVQANTWRGARRRARLFDRLVGTRTGAVDAGPDAVELLDEPLAAALASLSDGDRELLCLVAWDGLAHDEVGVVLGISVTAVANRVSRARRRLRRALDAQDAPALRGGA